MQPPERIYGWLDSQLSIARFYGGIRVQGRLYVIDNEHPEKPLVRTDVLDAERLQRIRETRARSSEEAARAAMAQGTLL